jgi:NAD+ kinase
MTMPLDLVLVRHGESEGNLASRAARQGNHGAYTEQFMKRHSARWRLTDQGIEQALSAGEWLRAEFPDFDRYYVSEYHRARETAALLGYEQARWFIDWRLREREWGIFDRMPLQQRESEYADVMLMQDDEPFYWKPPEGESLAALAIRLDRVLASLHREVSDGRALIVCHGEVMWTMRVMLERMSQERFRELHLSADRERIGNCQVLHYTRQDPRTGKQHPYYVAMRSICPWDPHPDAWQYIERQSYSSEELLEGVRASERLWGSSQELERLTGDQ